MLKLAGCTPASSSQRRLDKKAAEVGARDAQRSAAAATVEEEAGGSDGGSDDMDLGSDGEGAGALTGVGRAQGHTEAGDHLALRDLRQELRQCKAEIDVSGRLSTRPAACCCTLA
jgi:hypothetical protein